MGHPLVFGIARREADADDGIIVSAPAAHASTDGPAPETEEDQIDIREQPETKSGDVSPST